MDTAYVYKQKGNRLMIICYIILAITNIVSGSYPEAFSIMSAAYAVECCSDKTQSKVFYTLAALGNIPSMRFVGVLGYLFAAMGKPEISNPLLAMHYGLIGIDDSEISVAGRVASGALGLSFAL